MIGAFRDKRPLQIAAATNWLMGGSGARRRDAGPDLLNDLPATVWLMFEDDDVAAFAGDSGSGGDGC